MGSVAKTCRMLGGTEYFDMYTYDYIGNVLTEKLAYAAALSLAFSSKYEYDYAGRVIKAYNADGDYLQNTYNALGLLVAATDYAGTVSTFTYDSLGRLLTENTPVVAGSYSVCKTYYDAAGNVSSRHTSNNATHIDLRSDYHKAQPAGSVTSQGVRQGKTRGRFSCLVIS